MRRLVCFLLFSLTAVGAAAQDTFSEANLKAADPIAGEQSWQQYCAFCHTAGEGQAGMAGPNLYKLFQRNVGSKEGFAYSDALKNDGRDWTPELFAAYIARPGEVIPGNRMAAVDIPEDRIIALTAFVMRASGSVDWDQPKSSTLASGGLDAELRDSKPGFWSQYMDNTIKFTIPRSNGETYSFVAYFNEDGTITGNNRGMQGIWRMREKRKFCYSLERVGVHPFEWMHCLQPKDPAELAFGEVSESFAPVKGREDFQIEVSWLEGRPYPLEGDAHPEYWTFLFSTTTRYEIRVGDNTEIVDAYFYPDRTINSPQGVTGTWETRGEDGKESEMCYRMEGVPGVDGELSECFALVLMFNPRVGARWPARFVEGPTYWAETVAGRQEGY